MKDDIRKMSGKEVMPSQGEIVSGEKSSVTSGMFVKKKNMKDERGVNAF